METKAREKAVPQKVVVLEADVVGRTPRAVGPHHKRKKAAVAPTRMMIKIKIKMKMNIKMKMKVPQSRPRVIPLGAPVTMCLLLAVFAATSTLARRLLQRCQTKRLLSGRRTPS